MNIAISYAQGRVPVTIFQIQGEITIESYTQLQALAEQTFQAGTRNLLLDLSDVSYVSSSGLRAIHHLFNRLRTDAPGESREAIGKGLRDGTFKSPHLKLLNPSPDVFKALKTAGFDMFLEIHDDLQEAVASF